MSDRSRSHQDQNKESSAKAPEQAQPAIAGLQPTWVDAPVALQRALTTPPAAINPNDILALQRTVGNRAVTQLIQTKLTVGPVGDQYEQEADQVADQVLRMPDPTPPQPVQR